MYLLVCNKTLAIFPLPRVMKEGYLEKHQHEIINYERRSGAGKTIGSGRVEKGVDLAVGRRQKNKGMRSATTRQQSFMSTQGGRTQWTMATVMVPRSGCLTNG